MNRFFSFSGRIGRGTWWLGQIINIGILTIGLLLSGMLAASGEMENMSASAIVVFLVSLVVAVWVNLATCFQRYHDRDKSGFWFLISFIPFIGPVWMVVELGMLGGTRGANRWGMPGGSGDGTSSSVSASSDYGIEDLDAKIARMKADQSRAAPAAASPHDIRGRAPAAPAQGFPLDPARRGGFGRRGT